VGIIRKRKRRKRRKKALIKISEEAVSFFLSQSLRVHQEEFQSAARVDPKTPTSRGGSEESESRGNSCLSSRFKVESRGSRKPPSSPAFLAERKKCLGEGAR